MSQFQSHSQSNYLLTVDEVDDGLFIVVVFFVVEQRDIQVWQPDLSTSSSALHDHL